MLKTLRITSLVALIVAVCGVAAMGVLGLRGDSEIASFLDKPGVVDAAAAEKPPETDPQQVESPLVVQSKLFALRINPPPPPPPKVVEPPKTEPKKEVVKRELPPPPPVVEPPRPKGAVNAKFTLLATVMCTADRSRSMALLQQSGGTQEWFREGERVGHLDVDEVRDGSVVFSQGGRNPQTLFVPVKPEGKSLLKHPATTAARPTGAGSINVTLGPEPTSMPAEAAAAAGPVEATVTAVSEGPDDSSTSTTDSGRVRIQRSREAAEAREAAADRVRTRVAPVVRTPAEQKASIESNISSIQEIMSRDAGADPKQKEAENEAWMKLLKALEGEKKNLDATATKAADEDSGREGEAPKDTEEPAPDEESAPKRR